MRDPDRKARYALARAVLAPMNRYRALALEVRRRDLAPHEIASLCAAAEQARQAARALRVGDQPETA